MKNKDKIIDLFKKYPISSATLSKLVVNRDEYRDTNEKAKSKNETIPEIVRISDNIYSKIKQNGDLLQLFPDIELCTKIVISSILCPNDMLTTNISVESPESLNIPDSIKENITKIIEDYITDNYDVEGNLYNIIKEAMFEKGACVYAVIPEASVDDVINIKPISDSKDESFLTNLYKANKYQSTSESFVKGTSKYGYLGDISENTKKLITKFIGERLEKSNIQGELKTVFSSESFSYKVNNEEYSFILPTITDDFSKIKSIDKLIDSKAVTMENAYRSAYDNNFSKFVTMNNGVRENSSEDMDEIFKIIDEDQSEENEILVIKDGKSSSRQSIGKPMFMKIPTEAVVPVHAPGDPSKHIGYFVVLDEEGIPIDIGKERKMTDSMNMYNMTTGYTEQDSDYLNTRNKQILNGINMPDEVFANNDAIYSFLIKETIKDKVKNGGFGALADLNEEMNIYQMMFHRALKNLKTQMVFLPASIVQYFAYDYRENGTGKSELEKMSLLFSIRGTLFIASILAQIKNSISTQTIDVELEDLDQYSQETLDKIIQTFINNREPTSSIGFNTVQDIYSYIVEHQYKVNVNAAGLPAMKIDVDDTNRNVELPDTDFLEKLAEMQYLQLGVTPEMVNRGQDVEFATTIVNNHLLLGKESRAKQIKTNTMLKKFYTIILKNDFVLRKKISNLLFANRKKIIETFSNATRVYDPNTNTFTEGKKYVVEDAEFYKISEYIISKYERYMEVSLPEIIYKDANAKYENLQARFEEIDTIVDQLFDTSIMETVLGTDYSDLATEIQSVIKAYLKKNVVLENGFYPELTEMFLEQKQLGLQDSRVNIFKSNISDYKNLTIQLAESYKDKQSTINALKNEFQKYEDILGVGDGYSSGGSDYSSDSDEDGTGDGSGDEGGDGGMDDLGDIDKMLDDIDSQSFGATELKNLYERLKYYSTILKNKEVSLEKRQRKFLANVKNKEKGLKNKSDRLIRINNILNKKK